VEGGACRRGYGTAQARRLRPRRVREDLGREHREDDRPPSATWHARRPMRRALQLLAAGLLLLAAACAKPPEPGEPLLGLGTAQRDQFDRGKAIFNRVFQPETGLGPLFNANACGECHEDPVAGGVGDEVEVHATALRSDGFCDPLADLGGPVYQQQATPALKNALGIDKEPIPGRTRAHARRTSPDILGFGLLDAVPDPAILAYADPDDRNHDGISGRPNRF